MGTFIFTFFIGTLKDVWASGDWGQLLSFKVFFSIALFGFSFFIPKLIKRFRGESYVWRRSLQKVNRKPVLTN